MASNCSHAGLPPTGVKCPECRKGTLEVARGRFGPIYKCTQPGCGHWLPERPTGRKCRYLRNGRRCGALMVAGTKTIPERCSDRSSQPQPAPAGFGPDVIWQGAINT